MYLYSTETFCNRSRSYAFRGQGYPASRSIFKSSNFFSYYNFFFSHWCKCEKSLSSVTYQNQNNMCTWKRKKCGIVIRSCLHEIPPSFNSLASTPVRIHMDKFLVASPHKRSDYLVTMVFVICTFGCLLINLHIKFRKFHWISKIPKPKCVSGHSEQL